MTIATAITPYDAMTVTVPEGTSGSVEVRRFEVDASAAARSFLNSRGRGVRAGTYTALYRNGSLWMSDTPDEQRDHWPALWEAKRQGAQRALRTSRRPIRRAAATPSAPVAATPVTAKPARRSVT